MHDSITIEPFGPEESIRIDIYNDINIIFGPKGTGKTEILKAISDYYNCTGIKTTVYESSRDNLDNMYGIKGNDISIDLQNYGIESCTTEISNIRNAQEVNITSLSRYYKYFVYETNNKRANSIKIKDYSKEDVSIHEREFNKIKELYDSIGDFYNSVTKSKLLTEVLQDTLYKELITVLEKVLKKLVSEYEKKYIEYKKTELFNNIIDKFIYEIARKTGKPVKPTSTGFKDYADNRIRLEKDIKKIIGYMNTEIPLIKDYVGDLGEKGQLYCITELVLQNGNITSSQLSSVKKIKKMSLKDFAKKINEIEKEIYTSKLFNLINEIPEVNDIHDLLLFRIFFALNDTPYSPSNGEASMLLLHKELSEEKEVYILDEPEKSLGHDYINDVIVPLLKERAKMGKKVIIATHDANIAVRTLPYCSIYRQHYNNRYSTFIGNPFSDNLVDINDPTNVLNWKEVSMRTLEGGRDAFGERGKIYGDS